MSEVIVIAAVIVSPTVGISFDKTMLIVIGSEAGVADVVIGVNIENNIVIVKVSDTNFLRIVNPPK